MDQGDYSVCIGHRVSGHINTVVINGTSNAVSSALSNGTYINPVRAQTTSVLQSSGLSNSVMMYNTDTFEITSCYNVTMSGTIAADSYFSSSDRRLKTNIEAFPSVLENIKNIQPVKFQWKKDGRHDYGFIAQDFFKEFDFLREAHRFEGDMNPIDASGNEKFYSMEYPKITAILCKAVQELNEKLDILTKKNI